jgi:hypothetical protein
VVGGTGTWWVLIGPGFGPWDFGHEDVTRFLGFHPVDEEWGRVWRGGKERFALGHSDMEEMQVRKANLCLNRIELFVYFFCLSVMIIRSFHAMHVHGVGELLLF